MHSLHALFRRLNSGGKSLEFHFHGRQQLPDLRASALNGKRPESHLQTVQKCGKHRRPGNRHSVLSLDRFKQPRDCKHFGPQALNRQIEHGKIRRVGNLDVLVRDLARLKLDPLLEFFHRLGFQRLVGLIPCLAKPRIVLKWKLRVNRQQHASFPASGKNDGKLNALGRSGPGCNIASELFRKENFPQNVLELHFPERAAHLHVGKHPSQCVHVLSNAAHFPEAPIDGGKLFLHALETHLKPLGDGFLKPLLDRVPDLAKRTFIAAPDSVKIRSKRRAHALERRAHRLGKTPEPCLLRALLGEQPLGQRHAERIGALHLSVGRAAHNVDERGKTVALAVPEP